jgi:hypothetical protein
VDVWLAFVGRPKVLNLNKTISSIRSAIKKKKNEELIEDLVLTDCKVEVLVYQ